MIALGVAVVVVWWACVVAAVALCVAAKRADQRNHELIVERATATRALDSLGSDADRLWV